MRYYKNYQLKNLNSLKLESIAKEIWFPETFIELAQLLKKLKDINFFVISHGTNVLLKPVISKLICLKQIPKFLRAYETNKEILVSSSYSTSAFVLKMIDKSIPGFEGLYGIPGTIGGAIAMNSGSGEYSISDCLQYITTLDLEGNYHILYKDSLNFSRRYSEIQKNNNIILSANFKYGNKDLNEKELNKAKIHRLNLPTKPSAGGVFSNWHVLKPHKEKLIGLKVGDAEVSNRVNIIINNNKASYKDFTSLIEKIKKIVSVPLHLEIKTIG